MLCFIDKIEIHRELQGTNKGRKAQFCAGKAHALAAKGRCHQHRQPAK